MIKIDKQLTILKWPYMATDTIISCHSKVEPDENEDFLNNKVQAATRVVEGDLLGKDIALKEWVYTYNVEPKNPLWIPKNLNEIVSVVNLDSSTLITDYSLEKEEDYFELEFDNTPSKLELRFRTGYDPSVYLDPGISNLILKKFEDLYTVERGSYNPTRYNANTSYDRALAQFKSMAV